MSGAEADSFLAILATRAMARYSKRVLEPLVRELSKRSLEDLRALNEAVERCECSGMNLGVEGHMRNSVGGMVLVVLKHQYGERVDEEAKAV